MDLFKVPLMHPVPSHYGPWHKENTQNTMCLPITVKDDPYRHRLNLKIKLLIFFIIQIHFY